MNLSEFSNHCYLTFVLQTTTGGTSIFAEIRLNFCVGYINQFLLPVNLLHKYDEVSLFDFIHNHIGVWSIWSWISTFFSLTRTKSITVMLVSSCDQLMRRFRLSQTRTHCSFSVTHAAVAQHLKCFGNCLAHCLKIACGYHILPQVEMRKIALVCKDWIPLRERQVETYLFFISVQVQAVCAKTKVWKHRYKLVCVKWWCSLYWP